MLSWQTKILGMFAIAWFAVMAGLHVFWFEPMAEGLRAPDARPMGYGADAVTQWMTALGEQGRTAYMHWHSGFFDLVFPFLLFAALFMAIADTLMRFKRFADSSPLGAHCRACSARSALRAV